MALYELRMPDTLQPYHHMRLESAVYRVFGNRLEGEYGNFSEAVELARYLAHECDTSAVVRRDYRCWASARLERVETDMLCVRIEHKRKVYEYKLNHWDWTDAESNSYGPTCHVPQFRD